VIYVWLLDLLLTNYSSIGTPAAIHAVQVSQISLAAIHSSTVLNFSVQTLAVARCLIGDFLLLYDIDRDIVSLNPKWNYLPSWIPPQWGQEQGANLLM